MQIAMLRETLCPTIVICRVIFLSHNKNSLFGYIMLAVGYLVKRGLSVGLLTALVANH